MEQLRSKILASFLAVIAILMITGGFFVALNFMLINKYEVIMSNMVNEYKLIEKTQSLTESFNNLVKYIHDGKRLEAFLKNRNELQDLLISLDSSIEDERSFAVYLGVRNIVKTIMTDAENGVNAMLAGDHLAVNDYYQSINQNNNFVKENTGSLLLLEIELLKINQEEIIKTRNLIEMTAISLFFLMIILSIFYAFRFSDRLVEPLEKLSATAKKIVSGKIYTDVDRNIMQGKDEISSLAVSFDKMLWYLRNNISELKRFNEEIRESRNQINTEKNKLQQYLDVAGVFVIVFDKEYRLNAVNKKGTEIFGKNEDDYLNRDWVHSFVHSNDQNKTIRVLENVKISISKEDTIENIMTTELGEKRNVVWRFTIIKDEKGQFKSYIGTGVDITELEKAKTTIDQLREVDRLKNEVLNIATHELKTPLISIIGLSEVIKNSSEKMPKEFKQYIEIINSEGNKLNKLIKSMLASSRNELGKNNLKIEKINLKDFNKQLKPSLQMLVKRTNSSLEIVNNTKNLELETDQEKISQVIYNLVDNAVKYGPDNQIVKLVYKKEADNLLVEVIGMGKGIPKERQDKLFVKFSQLEPSLSRSQDGMGLGLYICKQNIESLGGTIDVSSEENKGATFYFKIPIEFVKNTDSEIFATS